jgi:hypothetical protein
MPYAPPGGQITPDINRWVSSDSAEPPHKLQKSSPPTILFTFASTNTSRSHAPGKPKVEITFFAQTQALKIDLEVHDAWASCRSIPLRISSHRVGTLALATIGRTKVTMGGKDQSDNWGVWGQLGSLGTIRREQLRSTFEKIALAISYRVVQEGSESSITNGCPPE